MWICFRIVCLKTIDTGASSWLFLLLYLEWHSTCFGRANRQQYLFDKCLMLYVQSWTRDDGQEDRPKLVVSFQNKVIWYTCASSWFYCRNLLLYTALWTSNLEHWPEIPGKVWNVVLEKGREDQSIKTSRVGNEVLQRGMEESYIAHTTKRIANWTVHFWCRSCILKHVNERK